MPKAPGAQRDRGPGPSTDADVSLWEPSHVKGTAAYGKQTSISSFQTESDCLAARPGQEMLKMPGILLEQD